MLDRILIALRLKRKPAPKVETYLVEAWAKRQAELRAKAKAEEAAKHWRPNRPLTPLPEPKRTPPMPKVMPLRAAPKPAPTPIPESATSNRYSWGPSESDYGFRPASIDPAPAPVFSRDSGGGDFGGGGASGLWESPSPSPSPSYDSGSSSSSDSGSSSSSD